MSLLISHVESSTEPEWKGYLYAVMMLATLITVSLTNAFSSQIMYTLGMNVKTAVTAAVYRGEEEGTVKILGLKTTVKSCSWSQKYSGESCLPPSIFLYSWFYREFAQRRSFGWHVITKGETTETTSWLMHS